MSAWSVEAMENKEREDVLLHLAEFELLGAAAGIARLVADKGTSVLSAKQTAIDENGH